MSSSEVLDDYELDELLGVGSVGTVHGGTHLPTGQRVAVKRLHEGVSNNELIRARFSREISVMNRLNHPNIVRIVGDKTTGKDLYYAMELVDGGSVKDLLQFGGALPWEAVVELGIQLCSALQWAHNHGVVHRDLKPSNLFLNQDGTLKLGDFGVARDLTSRDLTAPGITVGTHAYMAPEQIMGENISDKADLYALGCCLFEMLTRRQVFYGLDQKQLFDQHLKADPPTVHSFGIRCPPELEELIGQLLEKDSNDRPFNARAAQATLLKLADGNDVRSKGQRVLKERIQEYLQGLKGADIGWQKIVLILIGLTVFVGLAAWATR